MSQQLVVSSRANANIVGAYQWYEKRVPGLGADFIRRLDEILVLVQQSPQLFRRRRGKMRLATTPRFPYAVYFVWDEPRHLITISRVLHFAQDASAQIDPSR